MSHLKSDVFHTFWVLYEIYKRYKGIRIQLFTKGIKVFVLKIYLYHAFISFIYPTDILIQRVCITPEQCAEQEWKRSQYSKQ